MGFDFRLLVNSVLLPQRRTSGLLVSLNEVLNRNYFPRRGTAVDGRPCLGRAPCLLLCPPAGQAEALGPACGSDRQQGNRPIPDRVFFSVWLRGL